MIFSVQQSNFLLGILQYLLGGENDMDILSIKHYQHHHFYTLLLLLGLPLTNSIFILFINSGLIILVLNHNLLNNFCPLWCFILELSYHFYAFFPHPVKRFFSNYINLPPSHPKLGRKKMDTMTNPYTCMYMCVFILRLLLFLYRGAGLGL